MILRQARTAIAMLLLAMMATGCEHKDLCYDHPDHATRYQTQINASYSLIWEMPATDGYDWATHWPDAFGIGYHTLDPSMPEGLCVNAYSSDGRKTSRHLPPEGGIVEMTPGINSLLMYNDDTEYIVFDDLNNSVSAKATTRARSRTGYTGNTLNPARGNDTEKTVSPPDALFGYYAETFDQKPSVSPGRIDVTLKPLVFSYLVRYEFTHGVKYIGVARGALTGMAESVYLYDGHTGKTQATFKKQKR